jgi:hypothetical protein
MRNTSAYGHTSYRPTSKKDNIKPHLKQGSNVSVGFTQFMTGCTDMIINTRRQNWEGFFHLLRACWGLIDNPVISSFRREASEICSSGLLHSVWW